MRQFWMVQRILKPCDTDTRLHSHDLRGMHKSDWIRYLAPQISTSKDRGNLVASGSLINNGIDVGLGYMEWYSNISRRYITKARASYHFLVIRVYYLIG